MSVTMLTSKDFTASGAGMDGRADEWLADLLRLLGDPSLLRLLRLLAAGERNVTRLSNELRLPKPTVNGHLALLRSAGLIESRGAGKRVYYSLGGRVRSGNQGSLQFDANGTSVAIARAA